MAHCPDCKSKNLRRSRSRNRWERWRKAITDKRPYRCQSCQWRGWLPLSLADIEQALVNRPTATDPPNLRGTMLARPDPRYDLDLKALDRFHTVPEKDHA